MRCPPTNEASGHFLPKEPVMAKRYYQSKKDRRDESRGMKRRLGESYYEGYDERRRQEKMDGSMIREDHSAIANLPQSVKYVEYPRYGQGYRDGMLNDTARGIEDQVSADDRKMMKHMSPEKY